MLMDIQVAHAQAVRADRHAQTHTAPRKAPQRTCSPESDALEQIGARSMVRRGATLFHEGDPADGIYKVVTGAIRTSRLMPDGRRYVSDFLFPGDFIGLSDGRYRTSSAEALCDTVVIRCARSVFESIVENDPRFGRYLLSVLRGGLAGAQDRMLLLGRRTAIERVASFLLAMAARASSERIDLPMTRTDIADYLGLTIETVSRSLTQLKTQRVIQIPAPSQVVILRRDALEAMTDGV